MEPQAAVTGGTIWAFNRTCPVRGAAAESIVLSRLPDADDESAPLTSAPGMKSIRGRERLIIRENPPFLAQIPVFTYR